MNLPSSLIFQFKWVVEPSDGSEWNKEEAFTEEGKAVNSGEFDGLSTEEAKQAITNKLEEIQMGGAQITYKLARLGVFKTTILGRTNSNLLSSRLSRRCGSDDNGSS